jgi:putative transcriptional regulator
MATSDEHAEFCERVKNRRKELGLTQLQVAERLGMTQSTYANIERGRYEPGLNLVIRVAGALQIPPGELLPAVVRSH